MGKTISKYKETARQSRIKCLDLVFKAQTSHIGSLMSCADIMAVLFERIHLVRDKLVLSAGWKACMLYYHLWRKGRISEEELNSYCMPGSKFIGLAEPIIPEIPAAGGSMGYGLPFGVGFALAKKLKKEQGRVFVLLSDGELQIGTTWESLLIAKQHNLSNLVVLVDNNRWQAMGRTKDILNIEPIEERVKPFGWHVLRIDGHDYEQIEQTLRQTEQASSPTFIICDTIKGKGVKRFEDNNLYHYKELSKEEYEEALSELSQSNG